MGLDNNTVHTDLLKCLVKIMILSCCALESYDGYFSVFSEPDMRKVRTVKNTYLVLEGIFRHSESSGI